MQVMISSSFTHCQHRSDNPGNGQTYDPNDPSRQLVYGGQPRDRVAEGIDPLLGHLEDA